MYQVFDSGIIPNKWLTSIVKPIFKNKEDPMQPESTVQFFTSNLCKR